MILNTPVSKIRSASLGMVELNGLAAGPYTLIAPITERPCYYHRTAVWEWKQSGKNKQWVKVAAECMHVPFFLDDNTGKVLVDPRGADLDLHCDFQQEFCDGLFTTKTEAPDNVRSFLLRHGVNTTNKIKVEEFCIKPKNSLFVLGTLDENHGQALTAKPVVDPEITFSANAVASSLRSGTLSILNIGDDSDPVPVSNIPLGEQLVGGHSLRELGFDKSDLYRTGFHRAEAVAPGQVIQLSPDLAPTKAVEMTQQQKIAAALLKAGVASPSAWAAAGLSPSSVGENGGQNGNPDTSQSAVPTDGFDPHPPVVLIKGKNNPTFLISWRSQSEVASSLGWKCTLMIWGGPVLVLLSLYGLLTITHLI